MYRIVALTFFVIIGLIMGCSSNGSKSAGANSGVLNVAPAPIPAAEPIAAQPVSDSTPIYSASASNTSSTALSSKKTYTVKKGDTLFAIAKNSYGSGRDWQKIVAANPGLEPSKLKVGQTITIP